MAKWAMQVDAYCTHLQNRIREMEIMGGLHAGIPHAFPAEGWLSWDMALDKTMEAGDLRQFHAINCTADKTLTLPTAGEGDWFFAYNYGTNKITFSSGGILYKQAFVMMRAYTDGSGVPSWPTAFTSYGIDGRVYLKPFVIDQSDGKAYELQTNTGTVGTAGVTP
jgi:hypothetical protein